MDVASLRVQAAAHVHQRPAVLVEVAVGDARDVHVRGAPDLVIRAEPLAILGCAVAAEELDSPTAEVALNLRQDAQQSRIHRPLLAGAMRAEKAIEPPPRDPTRNAVPAEGRDAHLFAEVRASEPEQAVVRRQRELRSTAEHDRENSSCRSGTPATRRRS